MLMRNVRSIISLRATKLKRMTDAATCAKLLLPRFPGQVLPGPLKLRAMASHRSLPLPQTEAKDMQDT